MLYSKDGFVFLHSNCSTLLDLLTAALSEKLRPVKASDIEKVLAKRRPEIRSLGMQNLNAPGRSAPEGKIHFARDATYTLSPVRDAMFGFRHAFAVERGKAGAKSKPFGCSTTKRKVWGTWVDDSKAFTAECDRLASDLLSRDPGKRAWVLAAPVPTPSADIEPIAFYADYNIYRKGTVWIEDDAGNFSADWTCYFVPPAGIRFEVANDEGQLSVFDLALGRDGEKIALEYRNPAHGRRLKLCDDSGELEHRRSRDLVEALAAEEAFTVVFTQGLSYRSGGFWKNTGLEEVFTKVRTDMSWAGIDIRKESLAKGRRDTIGDGILRFLRKERWPQLVVCDDGSNEIADYLVVGKGRVALVHAKFSGRAEAGLRVDDVQVVLAQCLKNLQFFQWAVLEPHTERLATKVLRGFRPTGSIPTLIRETYENQRTVRECWVVQPGISASGLAKAPRNKIHALLNHADSACLPSNVEFHFFCNH
ncbi:MAG TPA: hypothetical protein VFV19_18820 [Candidatus Polarisedimenticolaceae bacterium]|nr:hypothetical protein [Candidatus Polarisedimenticolaceae bacterium]